MILMRLACVAVLSLFALAAATSASASPSAATTSRVLIVGGTRAQRALAHMTASRVGGVTLSRVLFRSPTAVLRHEHVRGTEMVVSSRGRESVRSDWEQELFVGSYLGYLSRWPKAGIAAAASFHTEGAAARLTAYDVFGPNPRTIVIARFREKLINAAARAKAQIVELRTAALPARVIAMTVRVSDPAAFLKHRAVSLLRILEPVSAPILGYYLGVENTNGALVFATSHLPNTGSVYVLRSLDSCSPVAHGEVGIVPPPPCPAH